MNKRCFIVVIIIISIFFSSVSTKAADKKSLKPSAESDFNCNINWKKGKTVNSVAKSVHKDFVKWGNPTGYIVSAGSGSQWITFSVGYKGASASVTVGNSSSSGYYYAAKYPKGKKKSRLWNNHPGKLTQYSHNFCGKKYTFSRSSVRYFIEYR